LLTKPGENARGLPGPLSQSPRAERIIQTMEDYFNK
jgi:hypothetical protein